MRKAARTVKPNARTGERHAWKDRERRRKEERQRMIAEALKVSINTVNSHRQNILQKLKANNSIEAVNFAQRLGLFNKRSIDKSEKRDVLS